MDKRKGLLAGFRKLGPTGRFIIYLTTAGLLLAIILFGISQYTSATKTGQKEINDKLDYLSKPHGIEVKPYLFIELASRYLLYNEQGNSVFPYKLRIAGGTPARNIKKGHMIFKLSGENTEKCKAWYEPENKNDVAYPGQKPVIHMDDIGKLNSQETYRAQLVITYTGTEDDKEEKFYSMANLELHPDKSDNRRHIIIQKSLGEGYTREIRIKKLINNCQELN